MVKSISTICAYEEQDPVFATLQHRQTQKPSLPWKPGSSIMNWTTYIQPPGIYSTPLVSPYAFDWFEWISAAKKKKKKKAKNFHGRKINFHGSTNQLP